MDEVALDHQTWATSGHSRISFGYPILDGRTGGGPAPGEVVLFVCRSGVGKTTFGVNVAVNVARKHPTLFLSLEMHARYILQRAAAVYNRTPTSTIERQVRLEGRSPAIDTFVRDYPHLGIVDEPGLAVTQIGETLAEAEDLWGVRPRLVIIDYFELVSGGMAMSESGQLDKLSRAFKSVARREDVVLLILHQTNAGAGEGHKPLTRADIRYKVDVAADYVLSAYRPSLNPELPYHQQQAIEDDFRIQFLKTRTEGGVVYEGVRHRYDPRSLLLEPIGPAPIRSIQEPLDLLEEPF